ncbi:MAG: hypothetical protein IKZ98_05630 [Clostridia bacterium]|nr:hypothetical protein [Clostridia bacterium]
MRRILFSVKAMLSPLSIISVCIVAILRTVTSYPFLSNESLADLSLALYGGVQWDMFMSFHSIAYWIMFLLPYLFGIVKHLSLTLHKNLNLTLYRFGNRTSWWLNEMISITIYVIILTIISLLISFLTGYIAGLRGLQMYLIDTTGFYHISTTRWLLAPFMACLNVLLLTWLYAITYLLWRDTRISTFIYIVPTIVLLLQYSNEEREDHLSSLLNWSMVQRYPLLAENGMPEIQLVSYFLLTLVFVFIAGMIVSVCVNPINKQ